MVDCVVELVEDKRALFLSTGRMLFSIRRGPRSWLGPGAGFPVENGHSFLSGQLEHVRVRPQCAKPGVEKFSTERYSLALSA